MIKPRQTCHFNLAIEVKEDWMIGLPSIEVYKSDFFITEENNKFELSEVSDEVSYEKVRDEIERDVDISDITATDLQHELLGPTFIEEFREHVTKTMEDNGYMNILAGYTSSVFQDFDGYPGTEVDFVEDVFTLV